MANIGQLTVDLRLVSQKFSAGLKTATGNLNNFRSRVRTATSGLGGMQARIAGLVGVAGFGAMINKSLQAADSISKMSDRLGISTENLSAFQHLAQLNGESIEGFDKSIEKMTRTIGEAQRGLGTGIKAFDQLGISVDDLAGKSPDEQFLAIADSIRQVEDKSLQASFASDIFGRSGIKLLNTMNQGREGFEQARTEVENYGLALSRVDGAKIEAANDAILRAQQVMKGAAQSATIELAPIIEEVANQFVQAGTEGGGFGETIKSVIRDAAGFIGVFADGIRGIKVIIKAVETALYGFGTAWASIMNYIVNDVVTPAVNVLRETLNAPLREILEFGAKLPVVGDKAKELLGKLEGVGKSEGITSLKNLAVQMKDKFQENKDELQALMLETIPSEAMKEKIDEVYQRAEEKAIEVAEKVKSSTEDLASDTSSQPSSGDDPDKEYEEKKTYLEKLADLEINNSKKVARFKRLIKLKELLANKFKAISEAVASAAWPYNIPAIAFATAEAGLAISGFKSAGSFNGGGSTPMGPRVGGIDGIGGMPAILHPNETVIDHTKGQSMSGMTLTVNNQFMGDVDEMMMQSLRRQSKQFARMVNSAVNNRYA